MATEVFNIQHRKTQKKRKVLIIPFFQMFTKKDENFSIFFLAYELIVYFCRLKEREKEAQKQLNQQISLTKKRSKKMKKMNKTYEAPVAEVIELNVSNPYMQTGTLTGSGAGEVDG